MAACEGEYYEIEELDLENEFGEEEKISTSKINLLIKCRCFVEKVSKSTQTSDDFQTSGGTYVETLFIPENSIDIDSKPNVKIFEDQSNEQTFCESFESIICTEKLRSESEIQIEDQNNGPEPFYQSFDSNSDAEANIEVLSTNTNTKVESESEDDDGLPPLDESLFLQPPAETDHCTKIDDYNYKCNICGKHFKQIQFFLKHYQVHQEFSMLCPGCGLHSSSIGTINSHHTNFRKYGVCYIPKKRVLEERRRRKLPKLPEDRRCKICGKEFYKNINMKDHFNVHTKDRPYICSCGSRFGSNENFYSHIKRFKCPLEGRLIPEYSSRSVLYFMPVERSKPRKRKKPSGSEKQEKPNESKEKIKNKELLKNNKLSKILKKSAIKKVECDQKLEEASVVYKPERKYVCGNCDHEFKTAANLRVHNEREHMDRKFSCSECSRKFAKEGLLNSHIKLYHIENRKCVECDLIFTSIKYKCHMQSRHKNKINQKKLNVSNKRMIDINEDKSKYKCSICNIHYYIKSYSKHFQSEEHLNAEKIFKLRNKINRFSCRKCSADPDGYDFIGEFLRHKVVFHNWYLRRNLEDFLNSFKEIKPNEECSREIT